MDGASPKASSLKRWASSVPLASDLVESLQTRCKKGFTGNWASRQRKLQHISLIPKPDTQIPVLQS